MEAQVKWKTKRNPHLNDERERIIFALIPRKCEDGQTRWFEYVKVYERYRIYLDTEGGGYSGWEEYAVEGL
jgi:hypothetical protein